MLVRWCLHPSFPVFPLFDQPGEPCVMSPLGPAGGVLAAVEFCLGSWNPQTVPVKSSSFSAAELSLSNKNEEEWAGLRRCRLKRIQVEHHGNSAKNPGHFSGRWLGQYWTDRRIIIYVRVSMAMGYSSSWMVFVGGNPINY